MFKGGITEDPAVITYAWKLVEEYNRHQRAQDRLHKQNHRPKNQRRSSMMWFGEKTKKTKERCKESKL